MKKMFLLFFITGVWTAGISQDQSYKIGCIGFYNFENLFDTLDSPDTRDSEFLPASGKKYNTERYWDKINNMAEVVANLGREFTPDGVALLGLAEIENRTVLEDFVDHHLVRDREYEIVHYDSPDGRGIDVALLYQPKYFQLVSSRAVPLLIYEKNGERDYTRDILYVSGYFDGELIHVLVNHWPSRSGGEKQTQEKRNAGAMVCRQITDSLYQADPNAKVFIMGDLNDDPISPSVKKVLQARANPQEVEPTGLFNPWWNMFRKGYGTLAYQDAWSLFDQIILSYPLINEDQSGYFFHKAVIYNQRFLIQQSGQFKGYPNRSWVGDIWRDGYSDHFPVYVVLLKKV